MDFLLRLLLTVALCCNGEMAGVRFCTKLCKAVGHVCKNTWFFATMFSLVTIGFTFYQTASVVLMSSVLYIAEVIKPTEFLNSVKNGNHRAQNASRVVVVSVTLGYKLACDIISFLAYIWENIQRMFRTTVVDGALKKSALSENTTHETTTDEVIFTEDHRASAEDDAIGYFPDLGGLIGNFTSGVGGMLNATKTWICDLKDSAVDSLSYLIPTAEVLKNFGIYVVGCVALFYLWKHRNSIINCATCFGKFFWRYTCALFGWVGRLGGHLVAVLRCVCNCFVMAGKVLAALIRSVYKCTKAICFLVSGWIRRIFKRCQIFLGQLTAGNFFCILV